MDKKLIKALKNGCTVWGLAEAKAIRELQREHPDWIDIISNMDELEQITGQHYDGAGHLPYFGAILTAEGKKNLC